MASQTSIEIPCSGTLLPTRADLVDIFAQLSNFTVNPQIPEETREKVKEILDQVDSLLGNWPISITRPLYPNLSIPELEWERRVSSMIQEYHLYVQVKILELIDAVLPISFSVPVLGLSIDILKIFTDAEYRASLKGQICDNIDQFYALVPVQYRTYAGEFGVDSSDLRCDITWSYLMAELNKGALGLLHGAFGGLIDKFKQIWDALGLPSLPTLLDMDVEGLVQAKIQSLREDLANAPDELKADIQRQISKDLESISLAGFSYEELVGGKIREYVIMRERGIQRKLESLRDFGEAWPKYLIIKWIEKIKSFLDAIGLGTIMDWVVFDFCDFLTLIGMPTQLSLPNTITITSLNGVNSTLESKEGLTETVENYINPPVEGS